MVCVCPGLWLWCPLVVGNGESGNVCVANGTVARTIGGLVAIQRPQHSLSSTMLPVSLFRADLSSDPVHHQFDHHKQR